MPRNRPWWEGLPLETDRYWECRCCCASQRAGLPPQHRPRGAEPLAIHSWGNRRKIHGSAPLVQRIKCLFASGNTSISQERITSNSWLTTGNWKDSSYCWAHVQSEYRQLPIPPLAPPRPLLLSVNQEISPREYKTLQTLRILNHRFHCHVFT